MSVWVVVGKESRGKKRGRAARGRPDFLGTNAEGVGEAREVNGRGGKRQKRVAIADSTREKSKRGQFRVEAGDCNLLGGWGTDHAEKDLRLLERSGEELVSMPGYRESEAQLAPKNGG